MDAQSPKPRFAFDAKRTPEENVETFFLHLESEHPGFAKLLRQNLPGLLAGTASRSEFNKAIAVALDAAVASEAT